MGAPARLTPTESNRFHGYRHVAAVSIAVGHAVTWFSLQHTAVGRWVPRFVTWISPLTVLFVLSGYLLTMSLDRDARPFSFLWRRVLRIYPALWVCFGFLLSVLLVAGYLTKSFVLSPAFPAFVVGQLTVGQAYTPNALRAFGTGSANGPLWSISAQMGFYLILPFLLAWLAPRARRVQRAVLISLTLASYVLYYAIVDGAATEITQGGTLRRLLYITVLPHLHLFLLGVLIYKEFDVMRRWVLGRPLLWAGLWVAASVGDLVTNGALMKSFFFIPVQRLIVVFAAFSFTFAPTKRPATQARRLDVSYGIYLYHYIIINILVEAGVGQHWWPVAVVVGSAATLAYLSYRFVEQPAHEWGKTSPIEKLIVRVDAWRARRLSGSSVPG